MHRKLDIHALLVESVILNHDRLAHREVGKGLVRTYLIEHRNRIESRNQSVIDPGLHTGERKHRRTSDYREIWRGEVPGSLGVKCRRWHSCVYPRSRATVSSDLGGI